jgi:hypothetical protein
MTSKARGLGLLTRWVVEPNTGIVLPDNIGSEVNTIGGWIVDHPGLERTLFGPMDPRAPRLDRVAESFALYGVDRVILL